MAKFGVKVKAIIPKKLPFPKSPQVKAAIREVLDIRAEAVLRDHQKTVGSWRKKPTFKIRKLNQYARIVGTDNKIWLMLDAGTRPHLIRAKNARRLSFRVPYRAKSRPGFIGSNAGSTGNKQVFALVVAHPGTDPRRWTEAMQKRENVEFPKALRAKLAEVNRRN